MDNETIVIRLLGSFHVEAGEVCADAQLARSPKGTLLMQRLLLAEGAPVPMAELVKILELNGAGALKTLVSRTRALLTAIHPALGACLVTAPGGYAWHSGSTCEVDFVRFEQLAARLHDCTEDTPLVRAWYDAALALYQGSLLSERSHKEWIIGKALSMQALYLATVQRYLYLLKAAGDHAEELRVCRTAVGLLPFSEALRLRLSEIIGQDQRGGGSVPGMQERLRNTAQDLGDALLQLKSELSVADTRKAVVCDNSIFREACRLTVRNFVRSDLPVGLGLVRIGTADGMLLDPVTQDVAVDALIRLMADSLRRGDVICRVEEDRIAVLLPTASAQTAQLILERIIRVFFKAHSADEFLISCRTTAL